MSGKEGVLSETERAMEMEENSLSLHMPHIHPHPLTPFTIIGFKCAMCHVNSLNFSGIDGYRCKLCFKENYEQFHKECLESPLELKHPYQPLHPLTLCPLHPGSSESQEACSCCGEELNSGWIYNCCICKFFMNLSCAKKSPVLEVSHPKSHDHKLFLLPKPRLFTCDACGLMLRSSTPPYACLQCGVMLHQNCINLPRVVRISRHHHRLCFASNLPLVPTPTHEPWSCGVCYKVVKTEYGAYFCIKGCHYVVHSKCATREDVWDGKDLEGEPEEVEDIEPPFEAIDDKVISHFSHEHHLKLKEYDDASFDFNEHCQVCGLPTHIHQGNIFSCILGDCNFVLHETCANLQRKIWFMLHPHRLNLVSIGQSKTTCKVCDQICCGFIYACPQTDCWYEVDVNCASISEPFIHNGHKLIPMFSTRMRDQTCSNCKRKKFEHRMMKCMKCDFILCFICITFPPTVRYKQDRHFLVLQSGEDTEGTKWWCEICERKMDPKELHYTCDSCCVTIHISCILGEDPHMMPGQHSYHALDFEVSTNLGCFRPLCHECQRRCPFPIVFKHNTDCFCTFRCLFDMYLKSKRNR